MANTMRVKEAVARAGLDALLLMDDRDIYYATGFLPTDSAALVGAEGAWLVTDSRYIEVSPSWDNRLTKLWRGVLGGNSPVNDSTTSRSALLR